MTTSVIRAGGTGVAGVQTTGGDDGALSLKVGPLSTTVEALSITSAGAATLASTLAVTSDLTANNFAGKNRIINGAMMVDQRNAGAAVTAANAYPVDRWYISNTANGSYSAQQVSDTPVGFSSSLKVTVTAAQTANTGNLAPVQLIEGNNIADLGWGAAGAKTVTLSFWVRSSLTGTFGGSLRNSASNRSYPVTYTISVADTWEYKTITIAGDTSGTWLTTNGVGIRVRFSLYAVASSLQSAGTWYAGSATGATGQTQLASTNGATFYITGVQLEKSSTATEFEYRPYGTELALCQRYFQQWGGNSGNERIGNGFNYSTTQARVDMVLPVTMRAAPTVSSPDVTKWAVEGSGYAPDCTAIAVDQPSTKIAAINFTVASGLTAGQGVHIMASSDAAARLLLSAEL